MMNNDVLRSVRYMLDISDAKVVDIIKLGGHDVTKADVIAFTKKDEEDRYEPCSDEIMASFLDDQQYRPEKTACRLRTQGRRHARHPQSR
jgi:uncharacterized protein YehS (DUF1456 family)